MPSPETAERRSRWDNVLDAENDLRRFAMGLTPSGVFPTIEDYNRFHELVHNHRVAVAAHTRLTVIK